MKNKSMESFKESKLNLNEAIIGGDLICTTWTEADGSGGGNDLYNTERKTMSYFE